jgi:hypothetical protein
MSTLDGFHVQDADPIFLFDGRVPTVGQRARTFIAHPANVVLVTAKCFLLPNLALEGAKMVVDHLPYDFVVLHIVV